MGRRLPWALVTPAGRVDTARAATTGAARDGRRTKPREDTMRIAALLTCTLLSGCSLVTPHAGIAPPNNAPKCQGAGSGVNSSDCTIPVTVTPSNGTCRVELADRAQDTVIFRLGQRDKWIRWSMDPVDGGSAPAGYEFDKDAGVVFKAGTDPMRNFDNGQRTLGGRVYAWKNRANRWDGAGSFPYAVKVNNAGGSITCGWDPMIKNE
jgi:hypothetical protein